MFSTQWIHFPGFLKGIAAFFSALQQSSAMLYFCRVPVKICISSINTTTKILGADVMSDESELLLHVYI